MLAYEQLKLVTHDNALTEEDVKSATEMDKHLGAAFHSSSLFACSCKTRK